jgi:microcystin-dependent protein
MKKQIILLCIVLISFLGTNQTQAQKTLGEISMFAGNFAPRGWAFCHGQILSINQNQSLYSLLGTTYGGDGRTTFALPDLRGRVAIHEGQGNGMTNRRWGQKLGTQTETLTIAQMPSHSHPATSTTETAVSTSPGEEGVGNGQHLTSHFNAFNAAATDDKTLGGSGSTTTTTGNTGGNQAHTNMQPSIAINYIICVQGVFPSRN